MINYLRSSGELSFDKTMGAKMSIFDEDLFLKGLEQRKSTLGASYVESNLEAADDFTPSFSRSNDCLVLGLRLGRRSDSSKSQIDDELIDDRSVRKNA